jgi:hypothetical protein
MTNPKTPTQRFLFEGNVPHWNALPSDIQSHVIQALAEFLLDRLDTSTATNSTTEDDND